MPALYTSIKLQTAWLEAQQGFPFKGEPMLLCAYDPDCDDILDLTDTAGLASHGVAAADLACAWKDTATRGATPPSWALSSRLATAGIAGIIVPSFAAGAGADDINVAFWRWSSDPPHQVRVIDDDHRLPKDDRSWL